MILLALLLLLAVAALVLVMLLGVSSDVVRVEVDSLGLSLNASPLTIYLLGVATMALIALAAFMLRTGSRRKLDKRRELKRLRQVDREQTATPDHGSTPTGSRPMSVDEGSTSTDDGLYTDPDRRR